MPRHLKTAFKNVHFIVDILHNNNRRADLNVRQSPTSRLRKVPCPDLSVPFRCGTEIESRRVMERRDGTDGATRDTDGASEETCELVTFRTN